MIFQVSTGWKNAYPGAAAGILAMRNAANPDRSPPLEERKKALEDDLRTRYSGWDRSDLAALPVLQAYNAYYKQFKKTYHV